MSRVDLCLALALSAALAIIVAATLGFSSTTAQMRDTRARLYRGAWVAFWVSILLVAASAWVATAAGLLR